MTCSVCCPHSHDAVQRPRAQRETGRERGRERERERERVRVSVGAGVCAGTAPALARMVVDEG